MSDDDTNISMRHETKFNSKLTQAWLLVILAITGMWNVLGPGNEVTKLIGLSCLVASGATLITQFKRRSHFRTTLPLTLQHYVEQLQATESMSERQQILDHMLVLNRLSHIDMSGVDLSDLHLANADLSGTNLSVSKQNRIDLSGADLKDSNLSYSTVLYANLRNANLHGANLYGATIRSSDLCNVDLRAANLRATSLYDCDLGGADLRGAKLCHADLRNANLTGTRLEGADLNFSLLPDGTVWSSHTDMSQFTRPEQSFNLLEMLFTHKRIGRLEHSNRG